MNVINPIPIRPKSFSDESAASLLIRASEMNGYDNIFSLCGRNVMQDDKNLFTATSKKTALFKFLGDSALMKKMSF